MNRDKAIEIAAETMGLHDFDDQKWASAVVGRADALLAEMDDSTKRDTAMWGEAMSEPATCCAATEARVVREIAEAFDADCRFDSAHYVRGGNWRAKEPVR